MQIKKCMIDSCNLHGLWMKMEPAYKTGDFLKGQVLCHFHFTEAVNDSNKYRFWPVWTACIVEEHNAV